MLLRCSGCPDRYRLYQNSHMFGGHAHASLTLAQCQLACFVDDSCIGIDWRKLDSTPSVFSRCYTVFPDSARYGALPFSDLCCDHYRKTSCVTEPSPGSGEARSGISLESVNRVRGQGGVEEKEGGSVKVSTQGVDVQDVRDPSKIVWHTDLYTNLKKCLVHINTKPMLHLFFIPRQNSG